MDKKKAVPYSVDEAKKERSRVLAHKRRATNRSVMDDLTQVLPLPKDVVTHLDYSSKLRLALCYFRLKCLTGTASSELESEPNQEGPSQSTDVVARSRPQLFNLGMFQDLMMEALDGFLLVLSSDGVVIYISESVHQHLGIFQSEHIGISIYDMISEEDHKEVREAMLQAETKAMSFRRSAEVSFFCRMKCSRFKLSNNITKSPGYKLVYVSGRMKMMRREHYLLTVVRPVSPPSILELRMEANMFVTHYDLSMNCTFFDGRLRHLLGYSKHDLMGKSPFGLQHHEDLGATAKCSEGIVARGEGLSGYYRFMCHGGFYVWLQTRGTLMHDSRTGKPTYIVCMNYIISKEDGDRDLKLRQAITDSSRPLQEADNHSYDPFPLTEREDGAVINPLKETSWGHKENVVLTDVYVQDGRHLHKEFEAEDVVVKQEEFGCEEGVLPSVPSTKLSPADSGLHSASNSLKNASASSSTTDISNNRNKSESNDEHCLPDSTTDTENSPQCSSAMPKSGEVVSESVICWNSPTSSSDVSDHKSSPPSVFMKDREPRAHVDLTHSMQMQPTNPSVHMPHGQYVSSIQFQNQNGSAPYSQSQGNHVNVDYGQDTIDATFLSDFQSLDGSNSAQTYSNQHGLSYNTGQQSLPQHQGVPWHQTGTQTSSRGQTSSGGQLYQLLSQQPLNHSTTTPLGHQQQLPGQSTMFPNNFQAPGGMVKQEFCGGSSENMTSTLPSWNGIEAKVYVHGQSQPSVAAQPGIVPCPAQVGGPSQCRPLSHGAGSSQETWPSDLNMLPQLNEEDIKFLDYFNNANPSRENLSRTQSVQMTNGPHPA